MKWYPDAIVRAGPAWKQMAGRNPNKGAVLHSAEGPAGGLEFELQRADRGAAWHFSILKTGLVEQHYPIDAVIGHSGDWGKDQDGANGNGELIGIEHEGVAGEDLTREQLMASIALVRWLAQQGRWEPSREAPRTLWEHRELSDAGTLCPSGRIRWEDFAVQVPQPVPVMLRWLYGVVPGMLDRTRWVRTETPSAGYRDDVYEVIVRRKVK